MAYQATNPGIGLEISAATGAISPPHRGFMALEEVTLSFVSGANTITSRIYPAGRVMPFQVNEILSISGGSIVAWVKEPNSGDAI
jgi:hypothetical protein